MTRMTEIEETQCCDCGTVFGMDKALIELRHSDGRPFYCPNGHGQRFTNSKTSKIDALEKRVEELKEELSDKSKECTRLKCDILKRDQSVSNGRKWWGGKL